MPSATPPSIVTVTDLQKRYGSTEAVRSVSFAVARGEIFGVIGPNGAGKTTTIECLLGLRQPDAGAIEICGLDARTHRREIQQTVGAALQTTALQDQLTPREALDLFAGFYRQPANPADLLVRFGLSQSADVAVDTLSGGQRQRLALALAFVNRPSVVFLDEPTAGLDPRSRQDLRSEILRMKEDGHTVVLTTHDLHEAEVLCDRVAIIDRGHVVAEGSPGDLMADVAVAQDVVLVTTPALPLTAIQGLPGVQHLRTDGTRRSFSTAQATVTLAAVLSLIEHAGVDVVELHVRRSSLEDVFLRLTTSGSREHE